MPTSLRKEVHDRILVLTIDRPEVRNAMDQETAEAIAAAMDELDARDDLSVGILTGQGHNFCSGMDLKAFLAGKRPVVAGRGFGGLTESPPRKVLIGAIEGYALAGGLELALACDLIVASRDAKLGLPEVKRGLVANAGGLLRLPRRLPYHLAMEVVLTGGILSAERAHAFGLVNRLCDPGEALDAALALAREIAANGPLAIVASKRIVNESPDWPREEMFARQREISGPVFASDDAREGAKAFGEKRAPVWTGR